VLAATYFVLLILLGVYGTTVDELKKHDIGYAVLQSSLVCFSALTNYLFLVSGSRLWEPALLSDKPRLIRFRKWSVSTAHVRFALIVCLCLTVLLGLARLTGRVGKWAEYPDIFLSFLALIYMGVALYLNSKSRREKLMGWEKLISWLALVSSICYAVLYFLWGFDMLSSIVGRTMPEGAPENPALIASLLLSLISLPLKFWIFYFRAAPRH
jgi:hypothetical protein